MSFAAHTLEFLLLASLVGALVLAICFLVARAYVRRRWNVLRRHPVTRGVLAAGALVRASRERAWARATPEQLSAGSAARVRRRMWVAVDDAEKAVVHASTHDAPVADLPSVCRSLRGLDRKS